MQIPTFLALLASISCAGVPHATQAGAPPQAPLQDALPPASGPLAVPQFEAEGLTLGDLLREFAELTDQHLVMTEQTRQVMQQTPVVMGGTKEIPAAEVYSFVEGLLTFHGFFTARLKGGQRPLLGVYWSRDNSVAGIATAPRLTVPAEELGSYADHPAFLIQTVLELSYMDTRQLSTSLRGMLRDTNTQTLLAVGEHGIVLAGTGQWVAEMASVMRAADEEERAAWERRAREIEARRAAEKEGAEGKEGAKEGGGG